MITTTTTPDTTTTTTTTTWTSMTQTPVVGFIRNTLSGRCIDVDGAPGTSNNADIKIQRCEYHISDTDQLFEVTTNGNIVSVISGKCLAVSGNPGFSSGTKLRLETCVLDSNSTNPSIATAYAEHRWVITAAGYIRNQFSGKCIDVDGSYGSAGGTAVKIDTCEFSNDLTDHKWEIVLPVPGYLPDISWKFPTGSTLNGLGPLGGTFGCPSTVLYTGMTDCVASGFIRNKRYRCIGSYDGAYVGAWARLRDCEYNFHDNSDQIWRLTSDGFIQNLVSKLS
jgi:hypothetical protein